LPCESANPENIYTKPGRQLEIPRRREVLKAKIFEGSIMLNWKIPHREGGEGGRGKSLQLKYFPWEGINISGAIQSKN